MEHSHVRRALTMRQVSKAPPGALLSSAAIVHWLYPDWSAAEVRSAIVNTADDDTLKDWVHGAPLNDVNIVGAGRENLDSAVNAAVALDPVSVSFGAVPYGSGQTQPFTLTLNELRGIPVRCVYPSRTLTLLTSWFTIRKQTQ